ncbi:MAG: chorismate mutase [Planctomycetota bacterium]
MSCDDATLAGLRREIEACDRDLSAALERRGRLVRAIGTWKRAQGLAPIDLAREAELVLAFRSGAARDGYGADALERVLRVILEESRRIVEGRSSAEAPDRLDPPR